MGPYKDSFQKGETSHVYHQQKWVSQKEYFEISVNILKFRSKSVKSRKKNEVLESILWLKTISLKLKH